jgi:mannose-6-phosphate isomerase-like protein (cupin superfamily)
MFIKKQDAEKFNIEGGTEGWLYPSSPLGNQTIAYIETEGVYPKEGYSINDICTETFFVIDGEMDIETNGIWYKLKAGDVFMVLPKTKYRSKGKGKILDLITPSWNKKQNRIINK